MKCPACNNSLSTKKAGDIEVEVCASGCGGLWFDQNEIKKFDEPHEFTGDILISPSPALRTEVQRNEVRMCPKCSEEVLIKQFFDIKGQVTIDQCWSCAGVFLDIGELATIRSQFETEEERQAAGDAYLDRVVEEQMKSLSAENAIHISRYDAETNNRWKSFLYGFKQLLWPSSLSRDE